MTLAISAAILASSTLVAAAGSTPLHQTHNAKQQLTIRFDNRGFSTSPDNATWAWGLQLRGYGWSDAAANRSIQQLPGFSQKGELTTYTWDSNLTEWFVNDSAKGLEHGYTVRQRPGQQGTLRLHLAVIGGLQPAITSNGRSVLFGGRLAYRDLKVTDARGKALAARFEAEAGGLRLDVDDSAAVYPLVIDPFIEQAILKATTPTASAFLGNSVSLDGDTMVAGAVGENSSTGAAYIYVRSAGVWTLQTRLAGPAASSLFGTAVSISGDTILVTAPGASVSGMTNAGSAYVYVRNVGTWTLQATLTAANAEATDAFGNSGALSGNTVVVGARSEDGGGVGVNPGVSNAKRDSGAAYVFVRSGATWTQEAYLKASNSDVSDLFGHSVAIDENTNTIVVGAINEASMANTVNGDQGNDPTWRPGAAYVFIRSGSTWSQQAYLKGSRMGIGMLTHLDGYNGNFGSTVAVDGDTVAVGMPNEGDTIRNWGAAYIFKRSGTNWAEEGYLHALEQTQYLFFGGSVALKGDVVIFGCPYDGYGPESSRTFLFRRSAGVWTQTDIVVLNSSSLSISGSTAAIGVKKNSTTAGDSGAVYLETIGNVNLNSTPSGAQFTVSGPPACSPGSYTTPYGFQWATGSCTVTFSTPQTTSSAVLPTFNRWADNLSTASSRIVDGSSSTISLNGIFDISQYKLTTASAQPTLGSISPATGFVDVNSVVAVTATPAPGARFTSWSGACTGTGACSVTMSAPKSVTAGFVAVYPLTTAVSPSATGTISPATGTLYDNGTSATVTATPASGYVFSGWSGDCTGTGACTVTMNAAKSVTANFLPNTFVLTTAANPPEGGTVTPATGPKTTLTSVIVTGTANAGYRFGNWSGAACAGTTSTPSQGTCTMLIDADKSVTANFVAIYTLTTAVSPAGSGTISPSTGSKDAGTVVTVTAAPIVGTHFVNWSGACTGTGTCTVTMDAAKSVTANFAYDSFQLTTSVSPVRTGSITPSSGLQANGAVVNVTAVPATGYAFNNWTGACTGTGACTVTMDAAKSVTAVFRQLGQIQPAVAPAGVAGSVTGGGYYEPGTIVTLQAVPVPGVPFVAWANCPSPNGTTCTITAPPAGSYSTPIAYFGFTITGTFSGGTGSFPSTVSYAPGSTVNYTVNPAVGSAFSSWSGDCAGQTTETCSLTMNSNKNVTANLVPGLNITTASTITGVPLVANRKYPVGSVIVYTFKPTANVTTTVVTAWNLTNLTADNPEATRGPDCVINSFTCTVTVLAAKSSTVGLTVLTTATGKRLTVSATPSNGGVVTPPTQAYATNSVVTLTATPNPGFAFDSWSSAACTPVVSAPNTCTITMSVAASVRANFVQSGFTLTTAASPTAGGTVSPATGTQNSGAVVNVTATANPGYRFSGWSGACTGSGACSVTMDAAKSVTANFVQTFALTTSASPLAGGTVSPVSGNFDAGSVVPVTAVPNPGYRFDGWSGVCSGSGPCNVTMDAAKSVTASFVQTFVLTTSANPPAGGTVTPASGPYDVNMVVPVTAAANPGYRFTGFSGACTGAGPCNVTMSAAKSVTANFVARYALTTVVTPASTGTISGPSITCLASCTTTLDAGVVTLTATPVSGYTFMGWSGACSGTGSCSVTLSAATTVTASFSLAGATSVTSAVSGKTGTIGGSRTWTLTYTNTGAATASNLSLTGFTLTPTSGTCSPVVVTARPVAVGNIAAGASATATVTTNFTGCLATVRFRLDTTYTYNGGAPVTYSLANQTQ